MVLFGFFIVNYRWYNKRKLFESCLRRDLMSGTLIFAITAITAALIFYTIGVFSERKHGLTKRNLALFWCGLACDTLGTLTMTQIAGQSGAGNPVHAVTGTIAIALMCVHAVWATVVLLKGNERQKANFHRFSIVVWAIWLVPYVLGLAMGMAG